MATESAGETEMKITTVSGQAVAAEFLCGKRNLKNQIIKPSSHPAMRKCGCPITKTSSNLDGFQLGAIPKPGHLHVPCGAEIITQA